MLRDFHVADFITLGNAACGVAAVFCAMVLLRIVKLAAPPLSLISSAIIWATGWTLAPTQSYWPVKGSNSPTFNVSCARASPPTTAFPQPPRGSRQDLGWPTPGPPA